MAEPGFPSYLVERGQHISRVTPNEIVNPPPFFFGRGKLLPVDNPGLKPSGPAFGLLLGRESPSLEDVLSANDRLVPLGTVFGSALGNIGLLGIGMPIGMVIGMGIGSGKDTKALQAGKQLDIDMFF